jgi:hypothetical protein
LRCAILGAGPGLERWVRDEREKRSWDVGMQIIRYSESPGVWKDTATITREVWPEYHLHSDDPDGATGTAPLEAYGIDATIAPRFGHAILRANRQRSAR